MIKKFGIYKMHKNSYIEIVIDRFCLKLACRIVLSLL